MQFSVILCVYSIERQVVKSKKILSVIIPVYNEERTVTEILDKVLARPETAEVIVVDDASTDKSRDVVQDY